MTRRHEDKCICGKRVTKHFNRKGQFVRCPTLVMRDVPPLATVLVEALRHVYAQKHGLRRTA